MENLRREDQPIDSGLTTATLAGMDERKPEREVNEAAADSELQRSADADLQQNEQRTTLTSSGNGSGSNGAANGSVSNSTGTSETAEGQTTPLFSSEEATDLHSRWEKIQAGFVDEPRRAVQEADALVAGAMKRLAEIFAEERARLDGHWDRGDNVSTEDLRVALRRYRSFFGRLLSV